MTTRPVIEDGALIYTTESGRRRTISLSNGGAFQSWLSANHSFAFVTGKVRFAVRVRKKTGSDRAYWIMAKRRGDKVVTKHLGITSHVTLETLHAVAATLMDDAPPAPRPRVIDIGGTAEDVRQALQVLQAQLGLTLEIVQQPSGDERRRVRGRAILHSTAGTRDA